MGAHDVHRAAVPVAVIIPDRPQPQVAHAVAVEIAQRGCRPAEEIAIVQDLGEAAFGGADLLVREDPAGLGRCRLGRGNCDQRGRLCSDTSCVSL